ASGSTRRHLGWTRDFRIAPGFRPDFLATHLPVILLEVISAQLPAVRSTVREEARDHIRLRVGIFAHVVGLLEDPALLGGIGLKSTTVAPKEIAEGRH